MLRLIARTRGAAFKTAAVKKATFGEMTTIASGEGQPAAAIGVVKTGSRPLSAT